MGLNEQWGPIIREGGGVQIVDRTNPNVRQVFKMESQLDNQGTQVLKLLDQMANESYAIHNLVRQGKTGEMYSERRDRKEIEDFAQRFSDLYDEAKDTISDWKRRFVV